MIKKQMRSRCKAKAKSGLPCRAAATAGGLCFFHANPDKAAELGRKGGRKNRHFVAVANADSLPKLDTAAAVKDTVKQLVIDVRTGQLDRRTATSLAPLLNLLLRAIVGTDLEQRMMILEELLARDKAEAEAAAGKRPETGFRNFPVLRSPGSSVEKPTDATGHASENPDTP